MSDSCNTAMGMVIQAHQFHTKDKIDMIKGLVAIYGEGLYKELEKVCGDLALKEWAIIAKENNGATVDDIIKLLWEPLKMKGLQFEVEAITNGRKVVTSRCPIYEMAKGLDGTKEIYHHTCMKDYSIVKAFGHNITLDMEQCMMAGDKQCVHYYTQS